MKKIFSLILSLTFTLSAFSLFSITTGCGGEKEFKTRLRFAVTSDLRLQDNGANLSLQRLNSFFDTAYAYSNSDQDYKNLDALFLVGDNTNTGSKNQLSLFFKTLNENTSPSTYTKAVMGEREFRSYMNSSWIYSEENLASAKENYLTHSGYSSLDEHKVISGYHFISFSIDTIGTQTPNGEAGRYYTKDKLKWLKEQIEEALNDDPEKEKPIFLFHHIAPSNTVYSPNESDKYLRDLLDDYPNVVDFSGHSRININDPKTVWQNDFTAISTGSLSYLDINLAGNKQTPVVSQVAGATTWKRWYSTGVRNGGMYYLCEVSEDNRLKLVQYDLINNAPYGDAKYFDSFGNPEGFDYKPKDLEQSEKPVFETPTLIIASNNYKQVRLLIPQAKCADQVVAYRVEVWNSSKQSIRKQEYFLSGYHLGSAMPTMIEAYINGFQDDTDYVIDVYAINAYGKQSDPISAKLTTSLNDEDAALNPDFINLEFLYNGTANEYNTNKTLTPIGNPIASEDLSELSFDGEEALRFEDVYSWYDVLSTSFSIETIVNVREDLGKEQAIISNFQNGGFSLFYKDGKIAFKIACGNDVFSVSTNYSVGEYAHVLAVYSNSKISLFINGELRETLDVSGQFKLPDGNSHYLVFGADSGANQTIENFSKCSIKLANLYTHALDEEGALKVYQRTLEN